MRFPDQHLICYGEVWSFLDCLFRNTALNNVLQAIRFDEKVVIALLLFILSTESTDE